MPKKLSLSAAVIIAAATLAGCSSGSLEDAAPAPEAATADPPSPTEAAVEPTIDPETRQAWADDVVNAWLRDEEVDSFESFKNRDPESARGYIVDYGSSDNGVIDFTVEGDSWEEAEFRDLISSFMGSVGNDRPGELVETTVTSESGDYSLTMTCEEIPECLIN